MTTRLASSIAEDIKRSVIEQSKRANVGHIGSSLSIADILAVLFSGPLSAVDDDDPDRDRFVLSKGHAALALYAALHACGRLTSEQLDTFCNDGTEVTGHPEHILAGIDFSTGSLGHGLSLATGAALAARLQGSSRRVVHPAQRRRAATRGRSGRPPCSPPTTASSTSWRSIDVNGQQALGYTRDVLDLGAAGRAVEQLRMGRPARSTVTI